MSIAAEPDRHYAAPARWLHWVLAVLVIGMIGVGIVMVNLPEGPTQDRLFENHEAIGFIVLWLVGARIAVRNIFTPPPPAATLSRFERIASTAAHHTMYVLLLAMPLLGWLGNSAYGSHISLFGFVDVPAILPKNEKVSDVLFAIHKFGGILLGLIILAHVGGALMHLVVKRDGVFQRMWSGR